MLLCEPFELGHSQKEIPAPASGSTTPAQSQAEIAPPTIPGCSKSHEKAHPEAIQVVVDEPPQDGSYARWCKDRIQFMLRVEPHAPPDDSPPPRGLDVRTQRCNALVALSLGNPQTAHGDLISDGFGAKSESVVQHSDDP